MLVVYGSRVPLWMVATSAVAVVFHRAVVEEYRPRFPIAPLNRRWIGYFWKTFFFFLIAGGVNSTSGSFGFDFFLRWIILGFVSLCALGLPAIAVGDSTMDWGRSVRATMHLWPSYTGGFLLALLPYYLAAMSIGRSLRLVPPELQDRAILLVGAPDYFLELAAVASAAVYLSRAYQMLSPTYRRFP